MLFRSGFNDGEPIGLNLRRSAGVEVRWISPFGPLRLAYGLNLNKREGEHAGVFEFSIGSLF